MKFFLILFVIIGFAFFVRIESFLDARDIPKRHPFSFSTIGSGSDQDYQMKCGTLFAQRLDNEFMTHYDYLFMCPAMAWVFERFTYIDSVLVFSIVTIIIGVVVAVTPFVLFSSPKNISAGGLVGSLILTFNPTMIEGSSGRFYIYPLVTLIFIFYLAALFKALRHKSPFWISTFAVMAAIQSLNKPFLFVSDMPFMLLFPFILAIKKVGLKKLFPYIEIEYEKKNFFKGLLAVVTYFSITVAYEIFHARVTDGFSFLTDLFIDTGGPSTKDAVLGASLNFKDGTRQQIENILALIVLATYQALQFFYTVAAILVGYISIHFSKKNIIPWAMLSLFGIAVGLLFLHTFSKYFLINNPYVAVPLMTKSGFAQISLLIVFILAVAFSNLKGFALVASHVFYFGALSMTLAAVYQPQLFVTIIIWLSIMIAYSLSVGLEQFLTRFSWRIRAAFVLVLILLFASGIPLTVARLNSTIDSVRNEVRYLRWVREVVPDSSYILGNGTEHLILVSKLTQKRVLTNALYVASKVEPDDMAWEKVEFQPSFPNFVKVTMEKNDPQVELYIMDHDIPKWQQYLTTGASETYPKDKYTLREVANSYHLNRKIYVLEHNQSLLPL